MVPALPVLGFVIQGVLFNFHLSCGEIPLEIGAVVHGIPQAELHIGEEAHFLRFRRFVADRQFQQQAIVTVWHQHGLL